MLFMSIYKPTGITTEASQKRNLQLFANWKPPAGFDIKSHYGFADGGGWDSYRGGGYRCGNRRSGCPLGALLRF